MRRPTTVQLWTHVGVEKWITVPASPARLREAEARDGPTRAHAPPPCTHTGYPQSAGQPAPIPADQPHSGAVQKAMPTTKLPLISKAARRALFTALLSVGGRPASPRGRAIPRANAGRSQATPSCARRLSRLVNCPVGHAGPRLATPGR